MGKFEIIIEEDEHEIAISYALLSDEQLNYLAKVYNYTIPEAWTETEKANLTVFALTDFINQVSSRMEARYIADNNVTLINEAKAVGDII